MWFIIHTLNNSYVWGTIIEFYFAYLLLHFGKTLVIACRLTGRNISLDLFYTHI